MGSLGSDSGYGSGLGTTVRCFPLLTAFFLSSFVAAAGQVQPTRRRNLPSRRRQSTASHCRWSSPPSRPPFSFSLRNPNRSPDLVGTMPPRSCRPHRRRRLLAQPRSRSPSLSLCLSRARGSKLVSGVRVSSMVKRGEEDRAQRREQGSGKWDEGLRETEWNPPLVSLVNFPFVFCYYNYHHFNPK